MKYFLATLIIMITLPLVAQAEVRINEIAWMGIAGTNGANGEWIELYNSGAEAVDLSGWKLYRRKGQTDTAIVTLTKTIDAGGYLLIERSTETVPDPIPGIDDESGKFGGGGLSNSGEILILKDASGGVVQLLDEHAWPAAEDTTTKNTKQWAAGTWITASPTPGAKNAETAEDKKSTITAQNKKTTSTTKSSAEPHIDFVMPNEVLAGVQQDYFARVITEHGVPKKGRFVWNMGDGTVQESNVLSVVRHTYTHAGTYTVTFVYFDTASHATPTMRSSTVLTVLAPSITLERIDTETLQIKNTAPIAIDISEWVLYTPEGYARIPPFTVLAAKGNMALAIARIGLRSLDTATLTTPQGVLMAELAGAVIAPPVVISSAPAATMLRAQGGTATLLASVASAAAIDPEEELSEGSQAPLEREQTQQHRTKTIIIGAVVVAGMALLLLLEHIIARQE